MKKSIQFAISLISLVSCALGSSPRAPYPYVEAESGSEYLFVMMPDKDLPFGKCYKIDDRGEPKLLWTVTGWYVYPGNILLSRTGNYLIKFLTPHVGEVAGKFELEKCLEIYAKGKLVKSLLVKDLVELAAA